MAARPCTCVSVCGCSFSPVRPSPRPPWGRRRWGPAWAPVASGAGVAGALGLTGELPGPGFQTVSPKAVPHPGPLLWGQSAARGAALGPGLGWRCSWSQTRCEFLTFMSSPTALVSLFNSIFMSNRSLDNFKFLFSYIIPRKITLFKNLLSE